MRSATVEFFSLNHAGEDRLVDEVVNGERLLADAPFRIDLDPADLLP
ncbi:hypothetical protein [Micromonospora cathayae]|uniref:Uncharacterized protein n=1 Tax=Micromonospora cathayae TaxID=3028804 RepID=A0ABY7ZRZ1_9ACTN|nr:hypothetical protein [Micromonospora sp. HUAS 3]WDZ85805.1 hypothetical protein PVK37_05040 [Micromonospora sp. HUAS 3]